MGKRVFGLLGLLALLLSDTCGAWAQVAKKPATFGDSEYRVGPEDVIDVFVWKEEQLSVKGAVIRPDGKVTISLAGEIDASGKTAMELQEEVESRLKKYLSSPIVAVTVKEVNSPKISIVGEVKKPDVYRIKQKTTVLGSVALAGGFTEFAKRDKVVVIRDGPGGTQKFKLNLASMLDGGSEPTFYLQPGDTVYVP